MLAVVGCITEPSEDNSVAATDLIIKSKKILSNFTRTLEGLAHHPHPNRGGVPRHPHRGRGGVV